MAWILGPVVIFGITVMIVGMRRNAVRLTRTIRIPDVQPTMTFLGSSWSLRGGGTLSKLEFFDWGIRIGGTGVFAALVPLSEVRYAELIDAQLVATRFSRGIRVRSDCLSDPVTFTTRDPAQIADLLEEHEVTINRNVGHTGWLLGDY